MLMYMFHIALALSLVALVMGFKLMCKAGCCDKSGTCDTNKEGCSKSKCCMKIAAYLVVILATISTLCTLHAGYMHMKMGAFGQGMVINLDMVEMEPMDDSKPMKKGK